MITALEKKGKGISRIYARVVKNGSKRAFEPFFEDHIPREAEVRTDGRSAYTSFKNEYPDLIQQKSGKKR